MPSLRIQGPDGEERIVTLDRDEFYVGRDASNAIKIESAKVSRKHARIFRKSGAYWLEDLGSVNGVLVDGQKLEAPRKLHESQSLEIGDHKLYYVARESAGRAAVSITMEALSGPEPGRKFVLKEGAHTVGRGDDCTISISDGSVSRRHAKVVVSAQSVWVEDLGSSNGTHVAGIRISKHVLRPSEVIRFGNVDFRMVQEALPRPLNRRMVWVSASSAAALVLLIVLLVLVSRTPPSKFGADDKIRDDAMALAEKALAAGDLSLAEIQFRAALDIDPAHPRAIDGLVECNRKKRAAHLLAMADAALKRNAVQDALRAALEAERVYPSPSEPNALVMARRAAVDEGLSNARKACQKGDFLGCQRAAANTLELAPETAEARDFVIQAEAALRAKKTPFVAYVPP